jgi:hypothetical protein
MMHDGELIAYQERTIIARGKYMTPEIQTQIEAAVFQQLIKHLDERKDLQNIELMNLAGFCRNCLAKWYSAAAQNLGEKIDYEKSREIIYGMSYDAWKEKYQTAASPAQQAEFNSSNK